MPDVVQKPWDFCHIPCHEGAWGRTNKAFGGQLPELIRELNEGVAA